MPLVLCITVVASVSLGVFAAYGVVFGMLSLLFGRRIQPAQYNRPRLLLVPRQNHASGD
jgi:drug/metabolite transporter superfamily protein YnfA